MLLAIWQTQRLTREIHDLERQAMEKQIQLMQYQKYAGMLGGSSIINIGNIAGLSSELIPRASIFAQFSNQASSMSAMQNLQLMKAQGMVPVTGNPMTQMQIEMSAFNRFKMEALKALKQQEAAVLGEKEKEIQLELNSINTRLTMKREELKQYKELVANDAREAAPKFGL